MLLPLLLTIATPAVAADFEQRQAELPSELFEVFNDRILTAEEEEALRFMYSYMPLPDLAGHSADFHLENIRSSLKARKEMPWGEKVPDREFRHFVLPVRVNNEALDLSRPVMYKELADRVKGLSMKDAILEVNHWCHEKVTYKPSDARTSPPLSAMSQAIGRCGEESTFAVAALRSVGIPARQVYTPRWAHTDDNHAWVEAWADGQWYFLGACEPAPVLDMAWFNAPASRGMLMTTNVFGKYDGPEEKLVAEPLNTTINVTDKYAPVKRLDVKVVDKKGNPVENARVAFSIYNYSEFFPAAVKRSDAEGRTFLTAGLGDMIVWATDGSNFGWAVGNPSDGQLLTIVLDKDSNYSGSFDMTIVPPRGSGKLPAPSAELVAENDRRFQIEDSIRKAYEATFMTPEEAAGLADRLGDGIDREKLISIIADSRGNSRMYEELLPKLLPGLRDAAVSLLGAVTEKDRRDIPLEVILDNITGDHRLSDLTYVNYILSPRIENEPLVPFKHEISDRYGKERLEGYRKNPLSLVDYVRNSVEITTSENPKLVRMDPVTVMNVMKADPRSRDIFFVALARTAGIPSRIDPVTSKVQILEEGASDWTDIRFDESETTAKVTPKGHVNLYYNKVGRNENPRYYSQFSISRIDNGVPRQLEYDEADGWKEITERNEALDAGQYMLMTGQRMADGSVLAHGEIFTVADGAELNVPLVLREDPNGVQVIGSLNAENLYRPLGKDEDRSILSTTGRGYYVLGIIKPGHEPSAHALNDLSAVSDQLEKWGRQIVVLFPDADSASRFDKGHFKLLPNNLTFGIDNGGVSQAELIESLNLPTSDLPIFVIADSFNRVVFVTQGYNIGLGDQLLDTLSKLE